MELLQQLKASHDELLKEQPEGTIHDQCPLCGDLSTNSPVVGGDMSFTQEDIDLAVAEATKPLNDKIGSLEKIQLDSQSAQAVAALQAEMDKAINESGEKIKDLQQKLDASVLEVESGKTAYLELWAYLEAVNTEEELKAQQEAVKASRLELIKKEASFPDDYLEANADRFAAMSEDDFEAALADWKTVSASQKEPSLTGPTALVASRRPASAGDDIESVMREAAMVLRGTDPHRI